MDHPTATSFAYSYGKQRRYTAEIISTVGEAGFACACPNFASSVERSTDSFQLPRIAVADCNGGKFAELWSSWLSD